MLLSGLWVLVELWVLTVLTKPRSGWFLGGGFDVNSESTFSLDSIALYYYYVSLSLSSLVILYYNFCFFFSSFFVRNCCWPRLWINTCNIVLRVPVESVDNFIKKVYSFNNILFSHTGKTRFKLFSAISILIIILHLMWSSH